MLANCYVSIMLVLKSSCITSIMLVTFNWVIYMSTIQFNLRVPKELKDRIDKASEESGRSINAEAVYRMEQSFVQENSKQREGIPLSFDEEWFEKTGLSKEELGAYVSSVVKKEIYKVDDK